MCKNVINEMEQQRFIRKGSQKIVVESLEKIHAVVYMLEIDSSCIAVGYVRRATKPTFNYRFGSAQTRADWVSKWIDTQVKREELKRADRKQRSSGHTLEVGDVLNTSWGYDQTNVDYYQVVGLKGKATVKLREIGAVHVDESHVLPNVDNIIGDVFEKRVNGEYNSVKISSCQRATPVSRDNEGNYIPSYKTPWGLGH